MNNANIKLDNQTEKFSSLKKTKSTESFHNNMLQIPRLSTAVNQGISKSQSDLSSTAGSSYNNKSFLSVEDKHLSLDSLSIGSGKSSFKGYVNSDAYSEALPNKQSPHRRVLKWFQWEMKDEIKNPTDSEIEGVMSLNLEKMNLTKMNIRRQEVIHELILTERDYVTDLRLILDLFVSNLRTKKILKDAAIKKIFGNTEELLGVAEIFERSLISKKQDAMTNAFKFHEVGDYESSSKALLKITVGDVFNFLIPYLRLYSVYCAGHAEGADLLLSHLENADHGKFSSKHRSRHTNSPMIAKHKIGSEEYLMKESTSEKQKEKDNELSAYLEYCLSRPECKGLDIFSFLIKPVQRICKYPLLLRELLKNTDKEHPDYELISKSMLTLDQVVTEVNERRRFVESQKTNRMVELYKKLSFDPLTIGIRYFLPDLDSSPTLQFNLLREVSRKVIMERGEDRSLLQIKNKLLIDDKKLSSEQIIQKSDISPRWLILFTDMIIIVKPHSTNYLFATKKSEVKAMIQLIDLIEARLGFVTDLDAEVDILESKLKDKKTYFIFTIIFKRLAYDGPQFINVKSTTGKHLAGVSFACLTESECNLWVETLNKSIAEAQKTAKDRMEIITRAHAGSKSNEDKEILPSFNRSFNDNEKNGDDVKRSRTSSSSSENYEISEQNSYISYSKTSEHSYQSYKSSISNLSNLFVVVNSNSHGPNNFNSSPQSAVDFPEESEMESDPVSSRLSVIHNLNFNDQLLQKQFKPSDIINTVSNYPVHPNDRKNLIIRTVNPLFTVDNVSMATGKDSLRTVGDGLDLWSAADDENINSSQVKNQSDDQTQRKNLISINIEPYNETNSSIINYAQPPNDLNIDTIHQTKNNDKVNSVSMDPEPNIDSRERKNRLSASMELTSPDSKISDSPTRDKSLKREPSIAIQNIINTLSTNAYKKPEKEIPVSIGTVSKRKSHYMDTKSTEQLFPDKKQDKIIVLPDNRNSVLNRVAQLTKTNEAAKNILQSEIKTEKNIGVFGNHYIIEKSTRESPVFIKELKDSKNDSTTKMAELYSNTEAALGERKKVNAIKK